jgi:hypothetical protein
MSYLLYHLFEKEKTMKKLFAILVSFIMLSCFIGCQNPVSGTTPDSPENGGGTKQTHVMPKFLNSAISRSFSSSRSVLTPSDVYDDFVIGPTYDFNHVMIVNCEYAPQTIGQMCVPPFNGFQYANYANGDTFTSTYFGRKIVSTAAISEDGNTITFTGKFNDGGSNYILVIDTVNRKFTLDQEFMTDAIFCISCIPSRNQYNSSTVFDGFGRALIYTHQEGVYSEDGTCTAGSGYGTMAEFYLDNFTYQYGPAFGNISDYLMYHPAEITEELMKSYVGDGIKQFGLSRAGLLAPFVFKSTPTFYGLRDDPSWKYGGGFGFIAWVQNAWIPDAVDLTGSFLLFKDTLTYDHPENFENMKKFYGLAKTDPDLIGFFAYSPNGYSDASGKIAEPAIANSHYIIYKENGGAFNWVVPNVWENAISNEPAVSAIWDANALPDGITMPASINAE